MFSSLLSEAATQHPPATTTAFTHLPVTTSVSPHLPSASPYHSAVTTAPLSHHTSLRPPIPLTPPYSLLSLGDRSDWPWDGETMDEAEYDFPAAMGAPRQLSQARPSPIPTPIRQGPPSLPQLYGKTFPISLSYKERLSCLPTAIRQDSRSLPTDRRLDSPSLPTASWQDSPSLPIAAIYNSAPPHLYEPVSSVLCTSATKFSPSGICPNLCTSVPT